MKNIILYTAVTIDGYIARKDGSLDWLDNIPNPDQLDYGYYDFYKGIGDVIMGRNTYDWVIDYGGEWPYPGRTSYIISRDKSLSFNNDLLVLWNDDFFEKATALKKNAKKDIWLIGGGEIVSLFLNEGLVDKMILTIVPTVLGDGLPLFPGQTKETHFELMDTTAYSTGLVNLVYRKKR